ncbi:MAG TPA: OmpW family outer membrane protein [Burkholderiaceae bacterium]|nr:OmpW family outer membrane protein [Burkholderiaceae bacterium]
MAIRTPRLIAAAIAAACSLVATQARADDSGWLVRGRVLNMHVKNGQADGLEANVGARVEANNKTFPEVDFTYFFDKNFAIETVLTYPQKHDISAGGTKIGTLKHLPPTVTAQYHFDLGGFKPYVGAGVNYTRFMSVDLPAGLSVSKSSTGLAAQVGADFALDKKWSLNVDLKYVQIDTDVRAAGAKVGTLKIDPTLFSVGVGYRF